MGIEGFCPHCGEAFELPANLAGTSRFCISCGIEFEVPSPRRVFQSKPRSTKPPRMRPKTPQKSARKPKRSRPKKQRRPEKPRRDGPSPLVYWFVMAMAGMWIASFTLKFFIDDEESPKVSKSLLDYPGSDKFQKNIDDFESQVYQRPNPSRHSSHSSHSESNSGHGESVASYAGSHTEGSASQSSHSETGTANSPPIKRTIQRTISSQPSFGPSRNYKGPGSVPASGRPVQSQDAITTGMVLLAQDGLAWYAVDVLNALPNGGVEIHFRGWSDRWDKVVSRNQLQYLPADVTMPTNPQTD
ncbi:hypothetical protein [Thalassoroseus pseudoceratinae]|uniref:hypothetical protein n=1 Tax=Thalassoroseus pseudoceratinae TaxID=2713176 RepID=UPI001422EE07|nr:hypothetical protein [Thalassoroseus pseudoceratinae]